MHDNIFIIIKTSCLRADFSFRFMYKYLDLLLTFTVTGFLLRQGETSTLSKLKIKNSKYRIYYIYIYTYIRLYVSIYVSTYYIRTHITIQLSHYPPVDCRLTTTTTHFSNRNMNYVSSFRTFLQPRKTVQSCEIFLSLDQLK